MLVDLPVAYSGHNQGDISLDLDWEVEHEGGKRRPGCYLDITVDLEVQEVSAFEYMIFIAKGAAWAEAANMLVSGGIGVKAQLNVQAVVGTSKL